MGATAISSFVSETGYESDVARKLTSAYIVSVSNQMRRVLARSNAFSKNELDRITISIRETLLQNNTLTRDSLEHRLHANQFDKHYSKLLAKALTQ